MKFYIEEPASKMCVTCQQNEKVSISSIPFLGNMQN